MVTYPDLSNLSESAGIGSLLSTPNASYPYFWAWIFAGIWIITTLTLYFKEKEKRGFGNILSSMSVASFSLIILATLGSIVGFITLEIFLPLLVLCFVIIGIWFFSGK